MTQPQTEHSELQYGNAVLFVDAEDTRIALTTCVHDAKTIDIAVVVEEAIPGTNRHAVQQKRKVLHRSISDGPASEYWIHCGEADPALVEPTTDPETETDPAEDPVEEHAAT